MTQGMLPTDSQWYKDAVIYELHVRAFFDSANDGVGDFVGLTSKLDYLQELGVTCLWLLPFYPSPLRDDGYDIANYRGIHPSYGTMKDFRVFLREAHSRGLRVVTELVINHTSDQHPWFQAARRAPAGSPMRDYYVWSDTVRRYADARIIFTDTERSNWTWDEQARAYYWHRFFHHQPDLNFDNPHVRRAVMKLLRYWLDMGVDGLRLDAIPYLFERDGSNCENLPETHEFLKQVRAEVDARYRDRMLLAEANQWPADVSAYFGDGDECHMAFHFPLMPRIFMALQQEDRYPIVEILRQTPSIPDSCQWAIFLRNHDELTLEMVTDEERDYMYQAYAADPQMRLNIGIRRRLAPLMENNRHRIELLYSMLFTLPGTPVLYYGDEIGMGDNVYLGDRNGVRTPMQWTGDRNAGFSRADFARLFAPPIMDPVYGYQSVNVEAQLRSPFSLLNWLRRGITVRKQHQVFGRGSIEFIEPANRRVLVYVREYEGTRILAVANLSRSVQPVEIDLARFAGLVPVELGSRNAFPRIGSAPYFLSMSPYGFYGFQLTDEPPASITARVAPWSREVFTTERPPLYFGESWTTLLDTSVRQFLERDYLAPFLVRQRWFGGKARKIASTRIVDWGTLTSGIEPAFLAIVKVIFEDGGEDRYFVPLALATADRAAVILRERPHLVLAAISGARKGVVHDGTEPRQSSELLGAIASRRTIRLRSGAVRTEATNLESFGDTTGVAALAPRRLGSEQSNTSIVFGDALILKVFRRLEPGPNPEREVCEHLQRVGFTQSPRVVGAMTFQPATGPSVVVGVLQQLVPHQANGWDHAVEEVRRCFERVLARPNSKSPSEIDISLRERSSREPTAEARDTVGGYLEFAAILGRRTAEMHLALARDDGEPAFTPQPFTTDRRALIAAVLREHANSAFDALAAGRERVPGVLADTTDRVLSRRALLTDRVMEIERADVNVDAIRVHGDYHLGQVLVSKADYVILDFEGEPARPLAERRAPQLALKDVAGMLRSFSYAANAALLEWTDERPGDFERLASWARAWEAWTSAVFLRHYRATAGNASFLPSDPATFDRLLGVMLLDKALYELRYELNNRPTWLRIPLMGILELSESSRW